MHAIKLFGDGVDDDIIPVFSAEPMIAVRGQHVQIAAFDLHDRDVESAATEIEHENSLVLIKFIEPVSERGSRRLVNDL